MRVPGKTIAALQRACGGQTLIPPPRNGAGVAAGETIDGYMPLARDRVPPGIRRVPRTQRPRMRAGLAPV